MAKGDGSRLESGGIGLNERGCRDLERATAVEWVDGNGRGGYAAGTVSGRPTRRYHGLLLVATRPPHERVMLVNHLTEWVESPRGRFALSTGDGAGSEEDGYRRCVGFAARPVPEWRYEIPGATIIRSIVCPKGRDSVIVRWQLLGGATEPMRLHVRPMLTVRPDHEVVSAANPIFDGFTKVGGVIGWRPRADLPGVSAYGGNGYRHEPTWRRGIEYSIDKERGEACREDWWSPGTFTFDLVPGEAACFTLTTDDAAGVVGEAAFDEELARRRAAGRTTPPSGEALYDELVLGAETYLVEMDDRAAVLAGVPWFDVWTRDTFTAFGGLLLVTNRLAMAERILATFAPLVQGGMLPNNLPDGVTPARWTSVDASLWYIVSVGRYARVVSVTASLEAVWPTVKAILEGYAAGTAHVAIRVTEDGLLHAADDDSPLTWMDAKCDGEVMTPRRGKPVEVQALWVQALGVGSALARRLGHSTEAASFDEARSLAIASFRRRFWCEREGHLFDVIDGPDGDDGTLRPNQLFALSFDAELVSSEQGKRVLHVVRRKLLTPRGLRTLAQDDPSFHSRYIGPRPERDAAYHQGTVWPFLLAPFVTGWLRFHGATDQSRAEAASFLAGIEEHLTTEGCLGHLSEIFDGDPPHAPRGCFAQAWSLGEILLALQEIRGSSHT